MIDWIYDQVPNACYILLLKININISRSRFQIVLNFFEGISMNEDDALRAIEYMC